MVQITKTIANLIKLELGEDYSVLENVFISGQSRATDVRIVLIRYGHKGDFHIVRRFGDGSYQFFGCLWTKDEAYEEMYNQIQKFVRK